VTFLGTADAFNGAGRAHSCYWVDDAHGAYAVDFGPTALMQCKHLGREPDRLDTIFLTHLHGDHTGGLAVLLVDLQYRALRTRPLRILGPPGTPERVRLLRASAYPATLETGIPFPLEVSTWPVPGVVDDGPRRITTLRAPHGNEPISASLRIETGGRRLVFSGDTGWQPELAALADGADLFVCECSMVARGYDGHTSLEELTEARDSITARRLYLAHLSAESRAAADRIRAIDAEPADDGLVVEIP